MANPFVHIELETTDLGKAQKFYASLFDWKLEPSPGPTEYLMIRAEGGPGGGMMKSPMPNGPSLWVPYVSVSDLEASTRRAKELGGKVLKENNEVPGMGWFSIVLDPTGAMFALWKAA
jgi:predicted enzyme related to lactoylglutathione lyase